MLSQLVKQLFVESPLTVFPLIALALFFAVFVAIAARVLARKPASFDAVARLPLDDGEVRHERY
jgi:cbb3-type cytochrome oxidase subunit 3